MQFSGGKRVLAGRYQSWLRRKGRKKKQNVFINYVQQCLSQCEGMAIGEVRLIGSASTEIGNSSSTKLH